MHSQKLMHSQNKLRSFADQKLRALVPSLFKGKVLCDILSVTNIADVQAAPVYIVVFDVAQGVDNSETAIARLGDNEVTIIYKEILK